MQVLKEYIRYYISGSLRESREIEISCQLDEMKKRGNITENVLRKFVRSVILEHINEVCGEVSDDVADALATAQLAHLGQKRRSGEPYLTHPVEVANIVHMYYPDEPVLCAAALLHDALEDALKMGNIEDDKSMESMIAGSFGDPFVGNEALRIVRSLTHAEGVEYSDYVLSLSSDPNVLKIKLADMLHNLQSSPSDKQKEKYRNALQALSPDGAPPLDVDSGHWESIMRIFNKDKEVIE